MTVDQHNAYFYWLGRVYEARGCANQKEREAVRQEIHQAAFGAPTSAKAINHLKMFDDFKAACLAVLDPTNLEAQIRQAEMPKTRLMKAVRDLAPEAYYRHEANRKFGVAELDLLDEGQLTELRNHLSARAAHLRWPPQASARPAAGRRSEVDPELCPF